LTVYTRLLLVDWCYLYINKWAVNQVLSRIIKFINLNGVWTTLIKRTS